MIGLSQEKKYIYPAFYRIAIGVLLLVNLVFLFPQLEIIFNNDYLPYIYKFSFIREYITVFACVYIFLLLLFIFGVGKRIITILVFVFHQIFYWITVPMSDWGTTVTSYSLLMFILIDSYQYFSWNKTKNIAWEKLHKIGLVAMQFHLVYIYMVNGLNKIVNPEWQNGSAVGYFFASQNILDKYELGLFFIENARLIQVLSYFVLFFQLSFIVVLFSKSKYLKYTYTIIGIGMHLFMAIIIGAWQFEISMILLYGFLYTDIEFIDLKEKIRKFVGLNISE